MGENLSTGFSKFYVGLKSDIENGVAPKRMGIDTCELDAMKIREKLNVTDIEIKKIDPSGTLSDDMYNPKGFSASGNVKIERSVARRLFKKDRLPRKLKKAVGQISSFQYIHGMVMYHYCPQYRTKHQRRVMRMVRHHEEGFLTVPLKNGKTVTFQSLLYKNRKE